MFLTGHSFLGIQWLQIPYHNAFPKQIGISGLNKVIMSPKNKGRKPQRQDSCEEYLST